MVRPVFGSSSRGSTEEVPPHLSIAAQNSRPTLDIKITRAPEDGTWLLTDLLGRAMGRISEEPVGTFQVFPLGNAVETMDGMRLGPFRSLNDALAAIERFTRGSCQRAPAQDG